MKRARLKNIKLETEDKAGPLRGLDQFSWIIFEGKKKKR